ncbi:MAG: hypothetical protein SGJ19_28015 [Planctomycetia bacterium]|nr:hypothetical protein [Planctomycetia bacterium]
MNVFKRFLIERPGVTLFVFALAVRLLAVQLLWAPSDLPRSYEHGEIAANLVAGRGFRVEFLHANRLTSQQAPFYPYLLAGAFLLFGTHASAADLAVQTLQCLAGAVICLSVVRLSRAVLPERSRIAWLAGYGAAIYPSHVYAVTHLQVAIWAALWLTLLADWCLSADPRQILRTGGVAGILGGLLILTEPILALALPVLALALWQRAAVALTVKRDLVRSARPTVVMTVATCLMIAPWIVRNYNVHGEWVFIKSTFGYAFWQGNNASSWGTDKIPMEDAMMRAAQHDGSIREMNAALWAARYETTYIDDLLLTEEDYAQFATLSEPACCQMLGERARQFIREEPGRYAALCLKRLRYFLVFDETNPKASHFVYRGSTVAWLALAVGGLIVTRRDWRLLWPTYAAFGLILLFHTLTITSARFRIPVEPLTFPWCAAGAEQLLRWVPALRGRRA